MPYLIVVWLSEDANDDSLYANGCLDTIEEVINELMADDMIYRSWCCFWID